MVNTELLQLPLHINNYQYEISYLYSINLKKIVVVYSTVQEKKMEKLNWRGLIREKDVDELKEALEEGVAIVFEILAPRHTDQQHTPLVLCPFAVCASAAQHTKQVLELVQYCVNVIRYATQRNATHPPHRAHGGWYSRHARSSANASSSGCANVSARKCSRCATPSQRAASASRSSRARSLIGTCESKTTFMSQL